MINWNASKADMLVIHKITRRAARAMQRLEEPVDLMGLEMDITACHCNGCPLKLTELLAADDFNFAHDVFGIHRHMDRETGHLTDCFVPRFAQPETATA